MRNFLLIAQMVFVVVILAVIVLAFFVLERDLIVRMDFTSFYTAANIVRNKMGHMLYDVSTQKLFQSRYFDTNSYLVSFRNLPIVALFFVPLTLLPLLTAYRFMVLINIVLLIVSAKLLSKYFTSFRNQITLLLVFLFFPALIAVLLGQISLLVLVLWIYIFLALKNKKAFLLGVLSALLANKLQFLVIIPFLLILTKNKKKFLFGFASMLVVVLIVSTVVVGWQGMADYLSFLLQTETKYFGTGTYSQIALFSAIHYYSYFIINGFLSNTVVYMINFLLFLTPLLLFGKNYQKLSLESNFSIATFLTLAFLPHGWEYALVVLLVPIFCLFSAIHKTRDKQVNRKRILLILLLFFLWTFRFWAAPFWVGIILAVLGSVLLVHKDGDLLFNANK